MPKRCVQFARDPEKLPSHHVRTPAWSQHTLQTHCRLKTGPDESLCLNQALTDGISGSWPTASNPIRPSLLIYEFISTVHSSEVKSETSCSPTPGKSLHQQHHLCYFTTDASDAHMDVQVAECWCQSYNWYCFWYYWILMLLLRLLVMMMRLMLNMVMLKDWK